MTSNFKSWLIENNGYFNPNAEFSQTTSGFSVVAAEALPSDSTIVKIPFSLAITQQSSKDALSQILGELSGLESWNERQWIASYLSISLILNGESPHLRHYPYVKTLPLPDQLRTGIFLTAEERELFKGTNLFGAIQDRERNIRLEWTQCHAAFAKVNKEWGQAFTWDSYRASESYISSRAFPSTLLSNHPSLLSAPETAPILLPGIDSLNHARGQPVSWVVTYPDEVNNASEPSISLVLHNPAVAGSELFNNYGAKPNSELILGYGFSLSENPEDTIVLQIGGSSNKWEVGRSARGADGLWEEVLSLVKEDSQAEVTYEDELDASSMLEEMFCTRIDKLPKPGRSLDPGQIRPEVVNMFRDYIEGQQDILDSLLAFVGAKEQSAIEKARLEGIDIVVED